MLLGFYISNKPINDVVTVVKGAARERDSVLQLGLGAPSLVEARRSSLSLVSGKRPPERPRSFAHQRECVMSV